MKDRDARALRSRQALLVALLTVAALAVPACAARAGPGHGRPEAVDVHRRPLPLARRPPLAPRRLLARRCAEVGARAGRAVAGTAPSAPACDAAGRLRPRVGRQRRARAAERQGLPRGVRALPQALSRGCATYTPWNEANHCSQPTCHHPDARRRLLRRHARRDCPRCTVVAADVLDQRNMVPWLRRFQPPRQGHPRCGACTTTSTPTACAPPARAPAQGRSRGTSGSPRPAGSCAARTTRRRSPSRSRAAHAGEATRLDPALRQPLRAHPPRLHLPVERQLAVPDVGLGADRPVRPAPPGFDVLARAIGRDPNQAPEGPGATPGPPRSTSSRRRPTPASPRRRPAISSPPRAGAEAAADLRRPRPRRLRRRPCRRPRRARCRSARSAAWRASRARRGSARSPWSRGPRPEDRSRGAVVPLAQARRPPARPDAARGGARRWP